MHLLWTQSSIKIEIDIAGISVTKINTKFYIYKYVK